MGEGMTLEEARELLRSPLWPKVRDSFLAGGAFVVHPKGDLKRLDYLDAETRRQIALWTEGLQKADEWRRVIDGAKVRELKEAYPGVYPEVFRYVAYFTRFKTVDEDFTRLLLKLKFPEVYELCYC